MATATSEPRIQRFATDADPKEIWQTVENEGVAIVPNVVPSDVIHRFLHEIEPRVETWENAALGGWKHSPHTKFVNGLLSSSHAYRADILNNPVLHAVCEAAFEQTGDYWIVSSVLRLTEPDHPAQPWHRDANGWPLVKSQRPEAPILTLTVIVPTTEFTEANGATRIHLGSHKWATLDPPSDAPPPAIAEMQPGDMLVMRQGVVHSGGEHTPESPATRSLLLLSLASCQLSQYESALTLPRPLVESLTPLVQKLVGWRTIFPLGHPMGLNTYRSTRVEEKLELQADRALEDYRGDLT
ncbi:MAG: hypothetical protein LQ350_008450 [Teloschistes chrysophthalmus]|nr:MAG: hypothetical protein LQ350_008450 [Niorma chrysophthalma]